MFFCDLRNGFLFKTFNWAFITSSPSGLVHHGDTVELTQQQHQRGFILFGLFMNCLPPAVLLVQIYLSGAREGSFLMKIISACLYFYLSSYHLHGKRLKFCPTRPRIQKVFIQN